MPRPDFDLLDMPPDPPSSGEPVVVFYVTDLTSDPELISVGFVGSDLAAELYIEIANANLEAASEFVRKEVLPLFGKFNPEILTRSNAATRIAGWLDELRQGDSRSESSDKSRAESEKREQKKPQNVKFWGFCRFSRNLCCC